MKQATRIRALALVLALCMLAPLAACAGGSEQAPQSSAAAAADGSQPQPAADGGGRQFEGASIKWQLYPAGDPGEMGKWNQSIIDSFYEETGCTVEMVGASWDDGLNKIMSSIAAGEGADVVQLAEQWTGQAYASGAFLELDSIIDRFGGYDSYFQQALRYGQFGGATYGLPWGGDCRAIYFRRQTLDDAGLTAPDNSWTWSEMVGMLKTIQSELDIDYPFIMEGSGSQFDVFYFWWYTMLARGGSFLSEDEKTATINTEAGRQALQDIIDLILVHEVLSPSMAETDPTMNNAAFVSGTAAVVPGATAIAAEAIAAGIPSADILSMTPPRGENGDFGAFLAISVISVYDFSGEQEAALAFLGKMMEPDWQVTYNKTAGWLPARIEAWNDEYFATEWRAPIRYGMENGTAFMPGNEHAAAICRIMAQQLGELYSTVALGTYQDGDVEKVLAAAELEVQAELDR